MNRWTVLPEPIPQRGSPMSIQTSKRRSNNSVLPLTTSDHSSVLVLTKPEDVATEIEEVAVARRWKRGELDVSVQATHIITLLDEMQERLEAIAELVASREDELDEENEPSDH